ncbi:glycosyl hydrolase family 43 protein [Aspergillus thermomutatus]|uniref:Alpha-galactosidase CBM13 domain-containing protein n=1 Tax=Aspergillus thermomutatus TaxID=41047 RepID=A0A397GTN3_ASPTH|nr:uncharacterized protein CDV56_102747 [Aspergillus thermomutatus]RHZ52904.1 hypothetical protein CDV56_102747 [Aspergillus thermomutatus]
MLLTSRLIAALALAQIAIASLQIVPGATWTASGTNQHVQAHGGGIIEIDSTYYWIGENKLNGSAFQSINCYSSKNLVEWTYVGELLSRQSSGDLGPNRVVERPKVIYNEATRRYVMWMHIDDSSYAEAKTGVATSSSVCGTYTYLGSFRPLGYQSRDMGLFKDDDGSAYLLTEDRPNGLRINRLTNDYTNVTSTTHLFPEHIEAPAMYKKNGVYFLFGSQMVYVPIVSFYIALLTLIYSHQRQQVYHFYKPQRHLELLGKLRVHRIKHFQFPDNLHPWSWQLSNVIPPFQQILYESNPIRYMGDRWISTNLMASTYIWLPLTLDGTTATLKNEINWILPLQGSWTVGPAETTPEAESSTSVLSNGAKVLSCSGCSGSKSVGWIGGPSDGTLQIVGVESSASTTSTIRVKYENGDSSQRYATVSVNGKAQVLAFLPSGGGNTPASSTLHVELESGSANTVTFSGYGDGYGPDIDRLMVPDT